MTERKPRHFGQRHADAKQGTDATGTQNSHMPTRLNSYNASITYVICTLQKLPHARAITTGRKIPVPPRPISWPSHPALAPRTPVVAR